MSQAAACSTEADLKLNEITVARWSKVAEGWCRRADELKRRENPRIERPNEEPFTGLGVVQFIGNLEIPSRTFL
jgi:hypothetical protein